MKKNNKNKEMSFGDFLQNELKNKKFNNIYHQDNLSFDVSQLITEARYFKGLSQSGLAKLLKTTQPSIARLESGKSLPSLSFLHKIAKALDTYLIPPRFGFMDSSVGSQSVSITEKDTVSNYYKLELVQVQQVESSTNKLITYTK